MPSQTHNRRRSSNTASTKSERVHEGRRGSTKTHERDYPQQEQRSISDAALYGTQSRDDVFDDAQEAPLRSARAMRNSKLTLASYGAKADDKDISYDVNVAVIGNDSVGKSTFIHKTLDLDQDEQQLEPPSRVLTIAGNLCMVRMFEMTIEEVYQGEHTPLIWPGRLQNIPIHGVMTLYDVGNKASFRLVPEVLNAVNHMSLPSVLAACKCDIDDDDRQLEPKRIEQRASSAFDKITTLQTSEAYSEPFRKAISAILRKVVNQPVDGTGGAAGARRRTLPNIPGLPPQRRPPAPVHSRSTSEIPGSRTRNEAPSASHYTASRTGSVTPSMGTSISSRQPDDMSSSFLVDEADDSASHTSVSTRHTDVSDPDVVPGIDTPQTPYEENGWSFDALVNRLLALPTSKADSKFALVFLTLYRKFAPPGRLLESIVVKFEILEHTEPLLLMRTISQLRYLTIIEQWIELFPGDFAHPKTLRRIKTFISKLQRNRLFATAAQEIINHIEFVAEDDDTEWAYCDKDRKDEVVDVDGPCIYRGSSLIDDPNFDFPDDLGSLSLNPQGHDTISSDSNSLTRTISTPHYEDAAQREASKLVPVARFAFTKNSWRALMQISTDAIAKEMTRIDWIMFSSIRPRDLIRHVSLSQGQKAHCKSLANIGRMIEHFNFLRDWTINFILLRDKPKHRALMLDKLMRVARKLRELNNYNSLGAVLAGIHSTPVHRLQATRDQVSSDTTKDWMKLEILMAQTRSFSSYRLAWENSNNERIPYLPLSIRDLVGAETGNKTFVVGGEEGDGKEKEKRVNWKKFEVMGDVLVSLQRAQGMPFRTAVLGQRNDDVRDLLLNSKIERDDDALYERSLQLEATGSSGERRHFKGLFKR